MGGISGATPGPSGADRARIGNSSGDDPGRVDSAAKPTTRPTRPGVELPETASAAGLSKEASFNVSSSSSKGTQAAVEGATTGYAAAQARALRLGFTPSQIETIISGRRESGDTVDVFRRLPQLCGALGLDGSSNSEEQSIRGRDKLLALIVDGGPEAMDALLTVGTMQNQNSLSAEEFDAGDLCDLLSALGALGHSYKQLGRIGFHNANALPVLLGLYRKFPEALREERRLKRANQLGVLAYYGGVYRLRALERAVRAVESSSPNAFDDVLSETMRRSGLNRRPVP